MNKLHYILTTLIEGLGNEKLMPNLSHEMQLFLPFYPASFIRITYVAI